MHDEDEEETTTIQEKTWVTVQRRVSNLDAALSVIVQVVEHYGLAEKPNVTILNQDPENYVICVSGYMSEEPSFSPATTEDHDS